MTQVEFFDKVDTSVLVAKVLFDHFLKEYPVKQIADVAETSSGGTPSRGNTGFYGGETPWLKSGELNDGLITSFSETITEPGLKNSSAKLFPEGTLLVAMYGATAGKTGILNFASTTNQAVCAIFPNDQVERDYLFWYFRQERFNFIEISRGGAQPNISQTVINRASVPIPPKEIQLEAVRFLQKVEHEKSIGDLEEFPAIAFSIEKVFRLRNGSKALSTENQTQTTLLRQLRQQLLQEAVRGELTKGWREQAPAPEPASALLARIRAEKAELIKAGKLKKEKPIPPIAPAEVPFELPEGWVWCRLGEMGNFTGGGTPTKDNPEYWGGEIPWVTPKDMKFKHIYVSIDTVSEKGVRESSAKLIDNESILIVVRGMILLKTIPIAINRVPVTLNQDMKALKLIISGMAEFILLVLNGSESSLLKLINTATHGTGKLDSDLLFNFPIPLPPLAEQAAIVTQVESLLKTVGALEAEVSRQRGLAGELMQAVLGEVLRG